MLNKVEALSFAKNKIRDISPLFKAVTLKMLNLSNNCIEDIEHLQNLI